MCGEQTSRAITRDQQAGSPPRVRGTVVAIVCNVASIRITPACAGNSLSMRDNGQVRQDHPRVCGEQRAKAGKWICSAGSPPRVRGTAYATLDDLEQAGITPACAGNSSPDVAFKSGTRDHPRVCGEQVWTHPPEWCRAGSPPRVRGTDGDVYEFLRVVGITPACAGNRWRIG